MKNNNIQVSLISPYSNTLNIGLRIISAVLRKSGYKTQMIFLPSYSSDSGLNISPFFNLDYPETVIQQIVNITRDSSIIGISLMDNYMQVGIKLTQALKNKSNLVIWGGVLPTLNPEEALQYADAVCIGEGEDAMLELVRKMNNSQDINSIPNIWLKGKSRPKKKYISDLSSLPLPDYGPEGHFIYSEKEQKIISFETCDEYQDYLFTKLKMQGEVKIRYRMETTRGCPHNCTYCVNNILKKIITPKIRRKSLDQIEEELNWVKKKFPSVTTIDIEDDCFIYRNDVIEVAQIFKKSGFPFRCLTSPQQFSEDKMNHLIENGLSFCFIGLQSKAPRIEAMYNRINVNKDCDKLFKFFQNNYPGFPLLIDVLVNNPWETTDDTLYTLKYLLSHAPSQTLIGINSLVFYRGTKLYEKAKQDNLLEPQHFLRTMRWHRQKTINYTTLLFVLLQLRTPKILIRFFALKPFIIIFERNIFISSLFPGIVMTFKKFFIFIKNKRLEKS